MGKSSLRKCCFDLRSEKQIGVVGNEVKVEDEVLGKWKNICKGPEVGGSRVCSGASDNHGAESRTKDGKKSY